MSSNLSTESGDRTCHCRISRASAKVLKEWTLNPEHYGHREEMFPTLIYLTEDNDAREVRSRVVWDGRMEYEDACRGSISCTAFLKGPL